jgi:hypothetical protein
MPENALFVITHGNASVVVHSEVYALEKATGS